MIGISDFHINKISVLVFTILDWSGSGLKVAI